MAQVSRAIKRAMLVLIPKDIRYRLLESHPNLRKAAPAGMQFLFRAYLGDISVQIDTTYKVERIMWTGEYESPLLRFLQSHATEGWCSVDVGANVGAVALALAKYSGPGGKVYAFEPGPPNQRRLRNNFRLNPDLLTRTELMECGVADKTGELWWSEEKGNPGNAVLSHKGSHRVLVTTLDTFFSTCPPERVDFVKIDVEGMELQVMRGAEQLLRSFRPILYFETLARFVKSLNGTPFAAIRSFLVEELGYELYRLGDGGEIKHLKGGHPGGYTLAIHPERPPQQR